MFYTYIHRIASSQTLPEPHSKEVLRKSELYSFNLLYLITLTHPPELFYPQYRFLFLYQPTNQTERISYENDDKTQIWKFHGFESVPIYQFKHRC